jgi:hypothetical protein
MQDGPRGWVYVAIAVAIVVVVSMAFGLGRCSAPESLDPVLTPDVDAGPGEAELAARLDAAVRAEDERLAHLEEEHAAEVAAFTETDRAEYEERRRDRRALAIWFKDRTLRILDAGVL